MSHRPGTTRGAPGAVASNRTTSLPHGDRRVVKTLLISVAASLALLWTSPPAMADPCSITDPDCLTEQVEDILDTEEETAGSAADAVTDTAEDAVETVQGAATEKIDKANDIVDGLLGRGDKDPDEDKGKDPGKAGGGSPRVGDRDRLGSGPVSPRDPFVDTGAFGADPGGRAPVLTTESGQGIGRAIAGGARALAFPVLLLALVLGFLAVQNRLDRRDPKLAKAPVGPEFLAFE